MASNEITPRLALRRGRCPRLVLAVHAPLLRCVRCAPPAALWPHHLARQGLAACPFASGAGCAKRQRLRACTPAAIATGPAGSAALLRLLQHLAVV